MSRAAITPHDDEVRAKYEAHAGQTVEQVMSSLGVTRETVRRAARRYGIPFAKFNAVQASHRPNVRLHHFQWGEDGPNGRDAYVSLPREPWL